MNKFFIYLEDIAVSPGYLRGWKIFKMAAVTLGPKNLARTRTQGTRLIVSRNVSLVCFTAELDE